MDTMRLFLCLKIEKNFLGGERSFIHFKLYRLPCASAFHKPCETGQQITNSQGFLARTCYVTSQRRNTP